MHSRISARYCDDRQQPACEFVIAPTRHLATSIACLLGLFILFTFLCGVAGSLIPGQPRFLAVRRGIQPGITETCIAMVLVAIITAGVFWAWLWNWYGIEGVRLQPGRLLVVRGLEFYGWIWKKEYSTVARTLPFQVRQDNSEPRASLSFWDLSSAFNKSAQCVFHYDDQLHGFGLDVNAEESRYIVDRLNRLPHRDEQGEKLPGVATYPQVQIRPPQFGLSGIVVVTAGAAVASWIASLCGFFGVFITVFLALWLLLVFRRVQVNGGGGRG